MIKNGFMNIPAVINGNNEVGDGQHRIRVAKELSLPVKFVVEESFDIEKTATANNTQDGWKTRDYIHKNAVMRNINYQRFQTLREKFPWANPNTIYVAMGSNLTGGGTDKVIKAGNLSCTEGQYEEACKMLSWLESFNSELKNIRGSKHYFYCSMMFVRRTKLINAETLTQRVKTNFDFSYRLDSIEDTVNRIENACNFKVAIHNRVYFTDEYKKAVMLAKSKSEKNIYNYNKKDDQK